MSKRADLLCPKCHKPLGFLKQVEEWIELPEEFGDEGFEPPTLLNLWCDHCKDMTTSIYWEENEEGEEIEVPTLRDITGGNDRVVINRPKGDPRHGILPS